MKRCLLAAWMSLCMCQTGFADANTSHIEQIGDGNRAEVSQIVNARPFGSHLDENISTITQTGTSNQAKVQQDNGSGNPMTSEIIQIGTANHADLSQDPDGGPGGFSSTIRQNGVDNRASVTQTGIADGIVSTIEQVGEGHQATVSQHGNGTAFDALPFLISDIRQTGFANTANVDQRGFSQSSIEQDGTNQRADVYQAGYLAGHQSLIIQSGVDNIAHVAQTGFADQSNKSEIHVAGNANLTEVIHGSGDLADIWNDSSITITGDGNNAKVLQLGHSETNTSSVTAVGDGNTVLVDQFTDGGANASQIQIDGGSNQITVEQNLSQDAPGTNTSILSIAGNGNIMHIIQQ